MYRIFHLAQYEYNTIGMCSLITNPYSYSFSFLGIFKWFTNLCGPDFGIL